ncbi:hypothetical protein [Numidum massiliense]|uniref:hypothetical protein n=1 Tax=Numidum massiliense TaxID=1522315 RepID=UPI0006D592EC|nr:hypothetical protein [Numidum massiliense]
MNEGVASVILFAIVVTLVCSGWCERLLLQLNVRTYGLVLWLALCIAATQLSVPVLALPMRPISVNVGFLFLLASGLFCLAKIADRRRPLVLATVLLAGATCFFVREMGAFQPRLAVISSQWLQVATLLSLAVTSLVGVWERFTLLTGGVTLAYGLSFSTHLRELTEWLIVPLEELDLLWTAIACLALLESVPWGDSWQKVWLFLKRVNHRL